MTKASDNPFPSLLVVEQGSAPTTPAAGRRRVYAGTDNVLKWIDEAGLVSPVGALNKWNATAAPTVNDDSGDGYAVGSRWIDTTNEKEYVCLDATVGAAVWTETTQAGGSGGTPLGITQYRPGSDSTIATIASTSQTDVDAVNVAVTFTAPASGNVIVEVEAFVQTGSTNIGYLGLREGTNNIVSKDIAVNNNGNGVRVSLSWYLTGVSAGSHTYKLAGSANSSSIIVLGGPTYGAVRMTVRAA